MGGKMGGRKGRERAVGREGLEKRAGIGNLNC